MQVNSWMVIAGVQAHQIKKMKPSLVKEHAEKRAYTKTNMNYWVNHGKRSGTKAEMVIGLFKNGVTLDRICQENDVSRKHARKVLADHGLIHKLGKTGSKPVVVTRVNGEFFGEFKNACEAALKAQVSVPSARKCLLGAYESSKGFIFKYKDNQHAK